MKPISNLFLSHGPQHRHRIIKLSALLLALIALLFTSLQLSFVRTANAQTWNLVWSDEFNGGSVDQGNWTFETGGGGWGNSELEYYTNGQNASVANGVLTITATKGSGGYNCWYGTCQYTSTRMNTSGKRQFTYGKVESRIAVPTGQGVWPAFWMLGSNIGTVGWPKSGEIDIMEHINLEGTTHGTIHWDANGHASYGCPSPNIDVRQYHTYDITWDTNAITWHVDGVQYCQANIANNINSTEEFHLPFFIILNLAIGGQWPGNPDASTPFPAQMQVDYVRVYQAGSNPTFAPPTNTPVSQPTNTPVSNTGDFTQGVTGLNGTQAKIWFKPTTASTLVDVHYLINGANQQNFRMTNNGGTWEQTVSNLSNGNVIEYWFTYEKNGPLYDSAHFTYTFNGGSTGSTISSTAWYSVINQNSNKCVDDANWGTANGSIVQQWACGGNQANQEWQFQPTDSGYYKVMSRQAPSLGWDVEAVATANGSKIHLWSYVGGANQQWKPVSMGNGYYKFVDRNSGRCLDVPSSSTADGVQLQIWDCNGTGAQSFRLQQYP